MSAPDNLTRNTPFGYVCRGCGRCCRDYLVRLNGFEIARLAGALAEPIECFLERYTHRRGGVVVLRHQADGRCVFRTDRGCDVYTDRPLACRLYPLAWDEEHDSWRVPPPNPESSGVYSTNGTIAGFLTENGAEPFLAAAREAGQ